MCLDICWSPNSNSALHFNLQLSVLVNYNEPSSQGTKTTLDRTDQNVYRWIYNSEIYAVLVTSKSYVLLFVPLIGWLNWPTQQKFWIVYSTCRSTYSSHGIRELPNTPGRGGGRDACTWHNQTLKRISCQVPTKSRSIHCRKCYDRTWNDIHSIRLRICK